MQTLLEKAIILATKAHAGVINSKNGEPYILHPLRVMLALTTKLEQICGILHDTVEDTYITLEILRAEGFPEEVIQAVDCLSKREGESYEEFIERLLINLTACKVKLADITDNSDESRLKTITPKDKARMEKYGIARLRIHNHIAIL